MYPIICKIGFFTIYSYGVSLVVAFLVSSYLAGKEVKVLDIAPETIFNLSFLMLVSGILGSRLLYVIFNLDYYLKYPLEILMLWHGGLSWFGGLFTGTIAAIIYIRKRGLAVYKLLDLIIPYLALGQAIGRVGCLLNGCCFGKEASWGLYFPVHAKVLIPTQLVSSLILLIIFIVLRFLQGLPHKDGEILFAYLILYSTKRFFIEFWRQDNRILVWGLSYFQIISVILFLFSTWRLLKLRYAKR